MTAPRGNHEDSRVNQLLNALSEYIDSRIAPAATLLINNTIRVDTLGNDGTGTRERYDLPFATINAALAVAVSGDTILIGAGTFTETVVIPDTLTSLDIVGDGMYETIINAPAGGTTVAWTGNATDLARLSFRNLSITAAAGQALVINADAQLTSFDDLLSGFNGLILDHVYLVSTAGATSMTLTEINYVRMQNCVMNAADAQVFTRCSLVDMWDCELGGVTFSYTVAGNKPSNARRTKNLYSCRFASLALVNLDYVICDADCISVGNIVTTIIDNALGLGTLEFHGTCLGNMTLGHDITLGARTAFFCDRCKLLGTLTTATAGVTNIATVNFRNAVLYTVAAGGISTGGLSSLDLIGAEFTNNIATLVAVGTGTCNRSYFRTTIAAPGAGAVIYTFAGDPGGAACPFTDGNYSVMVEPGAAGDDPLISAKIAAGFTYNLVAGATPATFTVLHE